MLRAYVALLEDDAATAVAEAERALVLVPDDMDPEAVATLRGTAGALLGSALRRAGDLERASVAYEAALPDLHVGGNVLAAARAISELASIAIARGDPYHAVDVCEAELARNDRGTSSASDGAVWYGIARARAALGQAELADAAARRALELATRSGDAVTVREAREVLAEVAQMPGGGRVVVRRAGDDGPVESLTPREIEVLRLVALGRSNRQIADELFVSVGTVKSHVNSISGKLGAANRVEAVARGRDVGLLG
jgi:ATP/maltotriose-dependent transcriptional regulator MalT